jgi:hypothetical protein
LDRVHYEFLNAKLSGTEDFDFKVVEVFPLKDCLVTAIDIYAGCYTYPSGSKPRDLNEYIDYIARSGEKFTEINNAKSTIHSL